ncbi:MAG: hypothetical protein CL440_06895 [Acidimicrobiaceae bacterium]|nr:hypothetical protein [Acidimicrobiaceae bacterium]|tara:strand:- start:1315 stop:1620 length:306 start_codon:yes stop_codon:yes gene_type:complete
MSEEEMNKLIQDEDGEWITVPLDDDERAEILAEREAYDNDISPVRHRRNALLIESDWTQMADSPLTDEKKAEWATYRQELRDFPSTATKQSEFGDWPTQPE